MKRKPIIIICSILAGICCLCAIAAIPLSILGISLPDIGSRFTPTEKTYELTVNTTEGGSVNITSGKYKPEDIINLQATPDEGYIFMGWYDDSNAYVTTSQTYNVSISKKTSLLAKFGLKPEEIKGEAAYTDELKNCSGNFSFTVNCDRPDAITFLQDNLQIVVDDFMGTEHEENASVPFTVEKISDSEYLISPTSNENFNGNYEKGVTYVAQLKEETPEEAQPEVTFGNETTSPDSLTFSIAQEETNIVEVHTGMIYLSMATDILQLTDDGKMAGDEGDMEDSVLLAQTFDITTGSIFCIYSGDKDENGEPVLDENSIYGKCADITQENGYYKIVYDCPELYEIYANLDIYMDEDINFEEAGAEITDETIEQIKAAFLAEEDVQLLVDAFQMTVAEHNGEYGVELLKGADISKYLQVGVKTSIRGTTASLAIELQLKLPIKKNGVEVAQIALKFNYDKSVSLNAKFNYKLKYWWFIPTGISSYDISATLTTADKCSIGIFVSEYEDDSYGDIQDAFNKEQLEYDCMAAFTGLKEGSVERSDSVKDLFDNNGYDDGLRKEITLFYIRHYLPPLTNTFDVSFFIDVDIQGSIYYTSSSSRYLTVGVRSSNGGSGTLYTSKGGWENATNLVVTGGASVEAGVQAKTYFSIVGLSKYLQAGVSVEVGAYTSLEGYISLSTGHSAGCFETGLFFDGYAYYKLFSRSKQFSITNRLELPFVRFGYDKTLVNWRYYDDLAKKDYAISLLKKQTDLFDMNALEVMVYETGESMSVESLSATSNQYKITVKFEKGTYLSYKNGKIIVKDGAPLYFEDYIKINVKSSNVWSAFRENSYCSYLDDLRIKITYGDEDSYYESIDNEIQKDFRNLYRSYNDANAQILKDMFDDLVEGLVTEEVQDINVYEIVVREYLNALFDTIKTYRAQEDDKRTMENKFVHNEAQIFLDVINWVNGMQESKEYNDEEFRTLIAELENSEVLYQTLVNIYETDEYQELAKKLILSQEARETARDALNLYYENSTNKVKAQRIVDIFTTLLQLNEV